MTGANNVPFSSPNRKTAVHTIAEHIYEIGGGLTITDAMKVAGYKGGITQFVLLIEKWDRRKWLHLFDDVITLGRVAQRYFSESEPDAEPQGEKVGGSQINLMTRKPYSTPKRVLRQDIPEWSRRPEGFSYITASGKGGEP
jgi:hypothetical protein